MSRENELGITIVDAALAVHRRTGPGLLESVYEAILATEFRERGLTVLRQVGIPISDGALHFEEGFRADLLVEDTVIVEIKPAEQVHPVHLKQLQTYLKLSGRRLGYLLNFGAPVMKTGARRCVNRLPD